MGSYVWSVQRYNEVYEIKASILVESIIVVNYRRLLNPDYHSLSYIFRYVNDNKAKKIFMSKKQVTKKQHYVWRGYLKRWTKENDRFGKIHTFRKQPMGNQPEYEYARLDEVGFGKFYYDMTGFAKKDIFVVSQLISFMQKDRPVKVELNIDLMEEANSERDFMEDLLGTYEDIDNHNHFIEKIIEGDLSFFKDTNLQVAMNIARQEMLNALFCGERKYSDEELATLALDAMQNPDTEDLKLEFLRFFFMQQERSPRVHDTQAENFEELKNKNPQICDVSTDFYVNSMMIFLAEQIATNTSTYFHTWLERLENKTDIPFITCDCPVVNLTGMKVGDKHEFYFPLSPTVAVKLCTAYKESKNSEEENKSIDVTDTDLIDKLNMAIMKEAYKEVFSNDDTLHSVADKFLKENHPS